MSCFEKLDIFYSFEFLYFYKLILIWIS